MHCSKKLFAYCILEKTVIWQIIRINNSQQCHVTHQLFQPHTERQNGWKVSIRTNTQKNRIRIYGQLKIPIFFKRSFWCESDCAILSLGTKCMFLLPCRSSIMTAFWWIWGANYSFHGPITGRDTFQLLRPARNSQLTEASYALHQSHLSYRRCRKMKEQEREGGGWAREGGGWAQGQANSLCHSSQKDEERQR